MVHGADKFKELFNKREYSKLSVDDKNKFIRQVVKDILRENPRGLTASSFENILPFDNKTIRKHLEWLTAVREAYVVQFGNMRVYYPNGKLAHYTDYENVPIGGKHYSFFDLRNEYGRFVYVQEKEKDEYNTFKVSGGLLIKRDSVMDFAENLRRFDDRIERG